MSESSEKQTHFPGIEHEMHSKPEYLRKTYKGSGKLQDKVALITGGDSGIGRSIAVHFAIEGCYIAISYKSEEQVDAEETRQIILNQDRRCLLLPGDLRDKNYCISIVDKTVQEFGKLNILINNAGVCFRKLSLTEITDEQLEETFDVNVFSIFRVTRAAVKYLHPGDSIINTASVNVYKGHKELVDYTASKGAVIAFTRSLAGQLAEKHIRVNAVAPGPIWTPMIVSNLPSEQHPDFGKFVPLGRNGQPADCAPCYVLLASEDSSYMTGQCLHPNGGLVLNT